MKIGNVSAIGNITSVRSVSAMQKPEVKPVDTASKNIKDDISDVERQKQAYSSKEDITVDEKRKRRQELQQELSSLKTKLRISEAEARKESQKEDAAKAKEKEEAAKAERKETQTGKVKEDASGGGEIKAAVQKQDTDKAKAEETGAGKTGTEKTGTDGFRIDERAEISGAAEDDKKTGAKKDKEQTPGFSGREMQSMIAEDKAAERAERQGVIVARIENDIVILKGEIKQDEERGVDVTKKKEELKEQEERAQRATNAQFSAIGQTNRKLQETAQDKLEEIRGEGAVNARRNTAEQPLIRATNYSLSGMV